MDALVDGLLEELNCDVVFKIPIFGGITDLMDTTY